MKRNLFISMLFVLFTISNCLGQSPDITGDKNWVAKDSDNFNYSNDASFIFNRSRAHHGFGWDAQLWGQWGPDKDSTYETNDYDTGHNYGFNPTSGFMSLIVKKEPTPLLKGGKYYNYTKGVLNSLYTGLSYKYGYYELRYRAPQPSYPAGHPEQSTTSGITYNWWTYNQTSDSPYVHYQQSEFDMCETGANISRFGPNVHYVQKLYPSSTSTIIDYHSWRDDPNFREDTFNFSGGAFHKVGVEWSRKYIRFYIDDKLWSNSSCPYPDSILPSGFIIHELCGLTQFNDTVKSYTVFPFSLDLDYIKIWQLDMDSCASGTTTLNKIDAITYPYGVKHAIHVTGNATSTITSGQKVFLRASDYIQIDKNFEVDKGAEFEMLPTPCQ